MKADDYEAVIGIECHVQLNTTTKLFAAVGNDARMAEPNTLISPICFGLPGVLPVLNQKAVELAIRAAIALKAEIPKFSKFDRKHYFYPDLPKGYQITQYDQPIIGKGSVEIMIGDKQKTIGIIRAHLEEDAGKLTHPSLADYSLVDLNRAGTPLLEIVSEPDISSPAEAKAFAKELYFLMKYAQVSDVDLYHGNMRFDVNISVRPRGSKKLGIRSEIKNLNSFKSVEKATEFEIKRQIELVKKGREVIQETRGWDEDRQKTIAQRGKEEAHDYRYFPDPDLPPVVIEKDYIESIRHSMGLLPSDIRCELTKFAFSPRQIEIIIAHQAFVTMIFKGIKRKLNQEDLIRISNWLTIDVRAWMTANRRDDLTLAFDQLAQLAEMVRLNTISSTAAKTILNTILEKGGTAPKIASELNLTQLDNETEIKLLVHKLLQDNPKAVEDIRRGETKAVGYLIGQLMKITKGRADPIIADKLIKREIGEKP